MIKLRDSIKLVCRLYDEAIGKASKEEVAIEILREKRRWMCRNDLFYLCKVTGNDKIVELPSIFEPFCDDVSLMNWAIVHYGMFGGSEGMLKVDEVTNDPYTDLYFERMYLCYRAFYKTTIVTKVHSLQLLLNFPNIRICLEHNKQDTSSDNLNTIKGYFLNTKVGEYFPEYIVPGKEWGNLGGFSVGCKTDYSRSEDSIEAVGVGAEKTGRHWDVRKSDDSVTQDSVNTEELIKKTKDNDARFIAGHFTNPKLKFQDYSGTRYHYADLYSEKKTNPRIRLVEIPLTDDGGNPTHPERFTPEDIVNIRAGIDDDWVFNCQMQLKPEDPAKKRFAPEMIRYWEEIQKGLVHYLLVDPANEKKKKSDYTAMTVVGVGLSNYFVVDMLRDKLGPEERIQTAIGLIKRYNIKDVGWEKVGLGNDTFYLEERRRAENLFFRIVEIKADTRSKVDRIRDILVPQYTNGQWLWPKKGKIVYHSRFEDRNVDMTNELEMEFLNFPGKHEDLLDTQTFLVQMGIVRPKKEVKVERKEGLTFEEWGSLRENRLKESGKNPWGKLEKALHV